MFNLWIYNASLCQWKHFFWDIVWWIAVFVNMSQLISFLLYVSSIVYLLKVTLQTLWGLTGEERHSSHNFLAAVAYIWRVTSYHHLKAMHFWQKSYRHRSDCCHVLRKFFHWIKQNEARVEQSCSSDELWFNSGRKRWGYFWSVQISQLLHTSLLRARLDGSLPLEEYQS